MPETAAAIDVAALTDELVELCCHPTAVDLGYDTLVAPGDRRIAHYTAAVIRPRLERLGIGQVRDTPGGLVLDAGADDTGRCLWLQSYVLTQHHNLMERPFAPRIVDGRLLAQGASQNKCHQAAMLAVLRALQGTELRGRLVWSVSHEGRSSHACSDAILAAVGMAPDLCVLQTPVRMNLQVANRGRVDVDVRVEGTPTHSSRPHAGHSAIEAVAEIVRRVGALDLGAADPRLGARHAVVYKVRYAPLAPHTIPGRAELAIDRRLLPGDTPAAATAELRAAIGTLDGFTIDVEQGVHMLPADVDPQTPAVRRLQAAVAAVRGAEAPEVVGRGTFDAGGPLAHGIPTVMFGAGGDGDWPLGDDAVVLSDVADEARVLHELIVRELT